MFFSKKNFKESRYQFSSRCFLNRFSSILYERADKTQEGEMIINIQNQSNNKQNKTRFL